MALVLYKDSLIFHWPTQDPFLFCAHHVDHYPRGNEKLEPHVPTTGRHLGSDFDLANPWKMYHGHKVPGFPVHPHRGFETVTIVLEGFVDHFDSGGGSGRYGQGDVQWMTAGAGLQHAEMFPLINQDGPNPLHLFQVWLNLPAKSKFVKPHYKMLWSEAIPVVKVNHGAGKASSVTVIAGVYEGQKALSPAPDSWAADPENQVSILLFKIAAGESLNLPRVTKPINRSLYHYKGKGVTLSGFNNDSCNGHIVTESLDVNQMAALANCEVTMIAGEEDAYLLLLEAVPLNEPVVQYGPFVMNTQAEIRQAYSDYQAHQFGGWPWLRPDPVHEPHVKRIALYSDGEREEPGA